MSKEGSREFISLKELATIMQACGVKLNYQNIQKFLIENKIDWDIPEPKSARNSVKYYSRDTAFNIVKRHKELKKKVFDAEIFEKAWGELKPKLVNKY